MAFKNAVEEMKAAGPAGSCANGQFASHEGFTAGRKRADLFVTDTNPVQVRGAHRVREVVDRISNDTPATLRTSLDERINDDFGDIFLHQLVLHFIASSFDLVARVDTRSMAGRKLSALAAFHQSA